MDIHSTTRAYFQEYSSFPLIRTETRIITFKEVWECAEIFAKNLSILEGRRIGVVAITTPETLILLCSLLRLNTQTVLLSPFEPTSVIYSYVKELQIPLLICDESSVRRYEQSPVPVISIKDLYHGNNMRIRVSTDSGITEGQPQFVVMTSGSSSMPKKVVLALENLMVNAFYSNRNLPFHFGDAWLLSLPLFHVSGLSILIRAIEGGGSVYVLTNYLRWWENDLPKEITHISVVSTLMKRLLDKGNKLQLKNLKGILLGGGPIPEGIVQKCYEMGLSLYTTYGLTEMSSQVTTTKENDTLSHLLTSGKPLIPETVRMDEDGRIHVRGPCRFWGYLYQHGLEQPFDEEGWFATQDAGKWTVDGYLQVLGRVDSVFICGGENIQPEEVENHILSSGFVDRVMVVPMKDEEYGNIPVAFVEFSEGRNEEDIKKYLKEKISGIKIPKYFLPFPKEFEGKGIKISRKNLIEWLDREKGSLE